MFWIMLLIAVMIIAIAIWGILKYPQKALWYKIIRGLFGIIPLMVIIGGSFLFAGMIGFSNAEIATVEMALILTGLFIVNFFILLLSGKLMFPKLNIWQQFIISLAIEISACGLILLSLYI